MKNCEYPVFDTINLCKVISENISFLIQLTRMTWAIMNQGFSVPLSYASQIDCQAFLVRQ